MSTATINPRTRGRNPLVESYSSDVWLDDGDDDTPTGAGLPDPSQRHWKHPSEVAADIAAGQSNEASPGASFGGWPIIWPFGVIIGGVSICSLAIVAVVLSGVGDKPMAVYADQAASRTTSSLTGSGAQSREDVEDQPTELDRSALGFRAPPIDPATTEFVPTANPSTEAFLPSDGALLAEVQEPVELGEGPDQMATGTEYNSAITEKNSLRNQAASSLTAGKELLDDFGLSQETTRAKQQTSPADSALVLSAEPRQDATQLGPYVVGDGYLLTTRAVLGQAQTAAIKSGDTWIALQAAIEAVGVVLLIPDTGYSLSHLAPETEPATALSVGDTVAVVTGAPTAQRIAGKVTNLGDRIATDIKFDPSLSGALLLDVSGVAVGLVTGPSVASSDTVDAVAISSAPGKWPLASLFSFQIVGIDDLAIEMTSSGLVVEQVPLFSPDSELTLRNLFEAGDKIVECNDVPMRSIADVAAVATDFTSAAAVTCTIVRQNSIIEVVQDVSGQLVATTADGRRSSD